MKEEIINFPDLPNATHTWQKILLPKGWLQYIVFEHQNVLGNGHYYWHGLSNKERGGVFAPKAITGGMLLFVLEYFTVVTSGAGRQSSRYVYKIGNYELKEPTTLYVHVFNNIATTGDIKARLKYSEKELEEVV